MYTEVVHNLTQDKNCMHPNINLNACNQYYVLYKYVSVSITPFPADNRTYHFLAEDEAECVA